MSAFTLRQNSEGEEEIDEACEEDMALTSDDLLISESLSDLERVEMYCRTSVALQRLVYVKLLSDTAWSVGFETTVEKLLPLLPDLIEDEEWMVRHALAPQFSSWRGYA